MNQGRRGIGRRGGARFYVGTALVALLCSCAALHTPHALRDYVGCWVTPGFVPIVILRDGSRPDVWTLLHERMLLEIQPIRKTSHLVLGHFYAWQEGESAVIGPVYEDGAYDPVSGTLTMGSPGEGLNKVRLLPDRRLLYVHTKAAATADMSVRRLDRIDCAEARALEGKLRGREPSAGASCPGNGESCAGAPHACCPTATLDCVYASESSTCGTNYVWLHVQHNRLSLPMSALAGACDVRFASLDEAKWECQRRHACTGITHDHGRDCSGTMTTFELRRGILWDTNPDDTYVSWVKKVFVRYDDTDLTDRFEATGGDECARRYEHLEGAQYACKLEEGCVGVVQLAQASCGGKRLRYELRRGGQTAAEGHVSWILQPTYSVN